MKTKDMTKGNALWLILTFGLPLILGNVFQQLYTVVDASVVGQGLGVKALAAVGSADWFDWLCISVIQGFAQGFSIPIAQAFGAKDFADLKKSIGNAAILAAALAALITAASLLGFMSILRVLNTPEDIVPYAASYIRIFLCGLPMVMLYNLTASVLRAVGDSKTPLWAMVISTVANVALDILFVVVLKWGISSAASATVISESASGLFCLYRLSRLDLARISKDDLRPEPKKCARLMGLGLPVSMQNAVIALGGMIVQSVVNGQGVAFIAGYTATNKLYGILEIAAVSFGYAIATYCGQNLGAGRKDRIRHGVHVGAALGVVTSVLICALMFAVGRKFNALFIEQNSESTAEAMKIAWEFLRDMSLALPILYLLHVYRNALQGLGNTVCPMVSGFAEFAMRTGSALLLPAVVGYQGIFFAEILAWTGADLILIPGYYRMLGNLRMPGEN